MTGDEPDVPRIGVRPRRAGVRAALSADELVEARRLLIEETTTAALLLLDPQGYVLTWNKGAEVIKGYRAEDVIGRHFSVFYPPEAVAADHPQRELDLAELTGSYSEDGWRVRQDGTRFWARVTLTALRDDNGDVRYFGKVTLDLTADRQKDEQLQNVLRVLDQTMRIDHLTGLPNRRAWDEEIVELLGRASTSGRPLAVAILDLDHFKAYNDAHGHVGGDQLLKRAAQRWRGALRTGDAIARYGGEEFVLALPGCSYDAAVRIVERIRELTPDGCTLSAGIALWDGEQEGSALIDRADRALYAAKAAGRDCVRRADQHLDTA